MSIVFLSKHEIGRYDTVETITRQYDLPWCAIRDIPANAGIRYQLPPSGKIPTGVLLSIPPHAGRLLRERLQVLHRLRPGLIRHFDTIDELAEKTLQPLLKQRGTTGVSAEIIAALAGMHDFAEGDIFGLARQSRALVGICAGLSLTHVAIEADQQAAGTVEDELCALYWAVSPDYLRIWRNLWLLETWQSRWEQGEPDKAWPGVQQFQNTVRSIVIQRIDERIRENQALERQVLGEKRQAGITL